ncbi:MAG: hypothetical protein HFJ55_03970 [Clostridia bacterium]|nr:hypothetical protein [Clostridia bacterium]
MKKIGFIGAYDKTDLLLYIAKILTRKGIRVIVADATITQKSRYSVPTITPSESYITEFEGVDVAVGFNSIEKLKQYKGVEDESRMNYDYMLVDTDSYAGVVNYNIQTAEKIYFVSSFDAYSLKRGIEILKKIEAPLNMTKIFYSRRLAKEDEYFDYLALGAKVTWNEERLYFPLENGDQSVIMENERLEKIKLKGLSSEYKENLIYLVTDIESGLDKKQIRFLIKTL